MAYPDVGEYTMVPNGTSFWALLKIMQKAILGRKYPQKRRRDWKHHCIVDVVDDGHCRCEDILNPIYYLLKWP